MLSPLGTARCLEGVGVLFTRTELTVLRSPTEGEAMVGTTVRHAAANAWRASGSSTVMLRLGGRGAMMIASISDLGRTLGVDGTGGWNRLSSKPTLAAELGWAELLGCFRSPCPSCDAPFFSFSSPRNCSIPRALLAILPTGRSTGRGGESTSSTE